jgi:translation initiation factor IF-2
MTEDRDFKDLVRKRAAKTGESYQAARRQLEEKRARFSARVDAAFRVPDGIVFGCVVEEGRVARGMAVTVIAEDGAVAHQATVLHLRRAKADMDSVADGQFVDGQFGMLVDPPYVGPLPARVTG